MPKLETLLKGRGTKGAAAAGDVPTREQGVENARRWIALLGGAQAAAQPKPAPKRARRSRNPKPDKEPPCR